MRLSNQPSPIAQLQAAYGENFEDVRRFDKLTLVMVFCYRMAMNVTIADAAEQLLTEYNERELFRDFEILENEDWETLLAVCASLISQLQQCFDGESELFRVYFRSALRDLLALGGPTRDARLAAEGVAFEQLYEGASASIYQREAERRCQQQANRRTRR